MAPTHVKNMRTNKRVSNFDSITPRRQTTLNNEFQVIHMDPKWGTCLAPLFWDPMAWDPMELYPMDLGPDGNPRTLANDNNDYPIDPVPLKINYI